MQAAIGSGFGFSSTADEVLGARSLAGTNVIVTGGAAGIGLATTRAFARAGAAVVVAVRSPARAAEACAGVPGIEIATLDLGDPTSIDAFAAAYVASGRPLHVLVNNAGIAMTPLARDGRGFESQLATNHLGHFQLTLRLRPALLERGRVVTLSSRGHQRCGVDLADPMFEHRPYDKWAAYGQSKTANVLFTVGLARRGIDAFAVHPGGVLTDLMRSFTKEELAAYGIVDGKIVREVRSPGTNIPIRFKSPGQGAATTVWAATDERLGGKGGVYCEDCDVSAIVEGPSMAGVRRYAIDPALAEQLWERSEAWTGVRF